MPRSKILFFVLYLGILLRNGLAFGNPKIILVKLGFKLFLDTSECGKDLKILLDSAINLEIWAMTLLDSGGKLPQGLSTFNRFEQGNYQKCISISQVKQNRTIQGKHCMVSIPFPKELVVTANESLKVSNIDKLIETRPYQWGVCVPSSCAAKDLQYYLGDVLKEFSGYNFSVTFNDSWCRTAAETYHLSSYDIAIISFFAVLVFIVLLSTIYDHYTSKKKTGDSRELLKSFSLIKNCSELFSIWEPKTNSSVFYSLFGLRCLAMLWVVYGHTILNVAEYPTSNGSQLIETGRGWTGIFLGNARLAVDMFFVMSGMLTVYLCRKNFNDDMKLINLPQIILLRYLRLTPLVFVASLLYLLVGKLTISQTASNEGADYLITNCQNNWWGNLLYIQNIYGPFNACIGPTWFLAVEFQLFLVAIIIILLAQKRPVVMYTILAILTIASCCSTFYITSSYKIPGIPETEAPDLQNIYYVKVYLYPHTRAGAYLVGMALGYFLYSQKDKKFKLSWWALLLFRTVTAVLIIGTMLTQHYFTQEGREYNSFIDPLYLTFHQVVFSIGVSFLIILCERGYGGFVFSILSHKFMQIPAKLTYALYLHHSLYIFIYYHSYNALIYYSEFMVFNRIISVYVCSLLISIPSYMCAEAPCTHILKLLLHNKWLKKSELKNNLR